LHPKLRSRLQSHQPIEERPCTRVVFHIPRKFPNRAASFVFASFLAAHAWLTPRFQISWFSEAMHLNTKRFPRRFGFPNSNCTMYKVAWVESFYQHGWLCHFKCAYSGVALEKPWACLIRSNRQWHERPSLRENIFDQSSKLL
jgi:hypothetical protein